MVVRLIFLWGKGFGFNVFYLPLPENSLFIHKAGNNTCFPHPIPQTYPNADTEGLSPAQRLDLRLGYYVRILSSRESLQVKDMQFRQLPIRLPTAQTSQQNQWKDLFG